jgi:hypothetical protein
VKTCVFASVFANTLDNDCTNTALVEFKFGVAGTSCFSVAFDDATTPCASWATGAYV